MVRLNCPYRVHIYRLYGSLLQVENAERGREGGREKERESERASERVSTV